MYNGMPLEGAQKLKEFMLQFYETNKHLKKTIDLIRNNFK